MGFPVPSEAFARLEIRALLDAGCDVSVSAFRRRPPNSREMLAEYGLEGLHISSGGLGGLPTAVVAVFERPIAALRLARRALEGVMASPRQSLIGLLLVPRALGIAREAAMLGVDRVHLFWGHYPALVGLALKEARHPVAISMFLGAYDLARCYPASRMLARLVPVTTHTRANVAGICEFAGLTPDQVSVIHRGVSVPHRPSPALRDQRPSVVVAERLVRSKRTRESILVFERVRTMIPDVVLQLFGDGPEAEHIRDMIAERELGQAVVMHGHVTHQRVQEAAAAAQVFLSMSQSEGERLPNAAKEAMAACCPVVLARSPGIDELVLDQQTGYIVAPGDVEGAAQRVVELLCNPERRKAFGDRGRRHIENQFDIAETTRQRLAFWGVNGNPGTY